MASLDTKKFTKDVFVLGVQAFEDFDIKQLVDVLQAADDLYTNDEESFLEDNQYDALRQYVQRVDPSNPYFTHVGSAVRGGKVKLPFSMGSLDQVYIGEWDQWRTSHANSKSTFVVSDKEDGGSNMIRYAKGKLQIAYSRGDGVMGADITRHIKHIPDVPQTVETLENLTVRCEHIISRKNFKKLFELGARRRGGAPYKNPRNMVAGLMNSSENDERFYKYINVIAYEIVGSNLSKRDQLKKLAELGFHVVPYYAMAGSTTEATLASHLETRRQHSDFEIDGLVIEIDDAPTRAKLTNGDSLNPGYAIKYKVADTNNFAIATVKEVEYNISKDGYYKPRVKIFPVDLVGVTIQHLTGFNAKFISDNKIGPGAKIKITRSGDVIPFILAVDTPAVVGQLPDDPDAVWNETHVDMVVADANSNPAAKFQRLNDFFSSIDVPHLGEGNLKEMFDMGFETPESIIVLSQEDISNLVGSRVIGKKIFASMRNRLTNIPLYELMGSHPAFGRGVGVRKMKKLYEAFNGDMSKCQSIDAIVAVPGFELKTAKKIAAGYFTFIGFFEQVEDVVTIAKFEPKKQGGLSGLTFVFTGFRNADLEKQIVDQGGTMGSTVSSKTSYLVTAEANSTSTKAKKAREIGVKVIGVDELKQML